MKKIATLIGILLFCNIGQIVAQDKWLITANQIDPSNYYGISTSNGTIGVVSSPEPLKVKEVILAGVYDRHGRGRTSNFLPSFNLLDMNLSIGWQDVNASNISNFKQELNMQNGTFTGSFDFKNIATIKYSYCALRQLPHSVMMEVEVLPHKDTYLVAENVLTTPSAFRDDHQYFNEINPSHAYIPLLTSVAKSPTGAATIVASNTFVFEEEHGKEPRVLHEMRDTDSHLMKFITPLTKDQKYTFTLIGTLTSSQHANDPYNQAERMSIYANLQGSEQLKNRHQQEWNKLWQSDITIEGDAQAQQDIHNMLYHLYSFTRTGSGNSLSPMGLSGTGYNGHIFWDTEIWMFPALLALQPQLAKELIEYRYNRLEAAKKNAANYGYRGAMFPWESALSGEEETPVWALSGTYEHHITADVAIAAWNYFVVTQDREWLKNKGWDILKNTADFWESRVTENNGKYEILNVVCADEWAENVDNNAYTNAAAKLNLEYANKAAQILGLEINDKWNTIANNLVFSEMENGVTREHDTYKGENIKQADVNLLAYPLKVITDKHQIEKDLKYYQERVPLAGTPAMTQAVFALLYSRLGNVNEAYRWFKDSYEPNLLPPFRVIAETKGGTNPYFITGAGGVLQAVMMGFGGIDFAPNGDVKQVNSVMPSNWDKLTITGVGKDKKVITRTK